MTEILLTSLLLFQAACLAAAVLLVLWLVFLSLPRLMRGAPYVAAKDGSVRVMLDLAALKPGETLVDLGSGDGRLLIAAARTGARAVGYDINLFLVWYARWRIRRLGLSELAEVRWGNLWKAELGRADAVAIFGFSDIMAGLAEKLSAELRPGARVVSLRYGLPGWPPSGQIGEARLYVK